MCVADHRRHQCSLRVYSYADVHSLSLTNGIFSLQSSLLKYSIHVREEHESRCSCSHNQRGQRWNRFSLGLHATSNALTASLSLCHVNFQVEIYMRSRGNALQHTLPDQLPHWSK